MVAGDWRGLFVADFLAAPSSSRSLVVGRSVCRSVGPNTFVKKLPLLDYKSYI